MKKELVKDILKKCESEDGIILVLDAISGCGQTNLEVVRSDIELYDDYFTVDTCGQIFDGDNVSGILYAEYDFLKAVIVEWDIKY